MKKIQLYSSYTILIKIESSLRVENLVLYWNYIRAVDKREYLKIILLISH